MQKLVIVGAGGHGKVAGDCARAMGCWNLIEFVDERYANHKQCGIWPVVGQNLSALGDEYASASVFIAVGDNEKRCELLQQATILGFTPVNVVHPKSYVSPDAKLGACILVCAGAVVNIEAEIGNGCIVNTGANIDHDCKLSDGVHISPGVSLGGGVVVGRCSWVGIGAVVKQYVSIGSEVIVGAGATVVSNIDSKLTVIGTPAKAR